MTTSDTSSDTEPNREIVFVTGMSGAGKSTALKILEDYGFEAVDNLPVSLLGNLVLSGADGDPVAIGVDVRTRDFNADRLVHEINRLTETPGLAVTVLFLECGDAELENRFKTTRRRHPLAHDRRIIDGIEQERGLIRPLKQTANMVIDTTDRSVVDFRHFMDAQFKESADAGLTLFVTSFSFAHGIPREADILFDVRFLRNPHYDPDLQSMSGKDDPVGAFIRQDPDFSTFLENLKQLIEPLLPRYADEGKSYLTIAVGCTGGRHRSVYVAETLARWLEDEKETVHVLHRDLEKPRK